jgi:hypothetical protein
VEGWVPCRRPETGAPADYLRLQIVEIPNVFMQASQTLGFWVGKAQRHYRFKEFAIY